MQAAAQLSFLVFFCMGILTKNVDMVSTIDYLSDPVCLLLVIPSSHQKQLAAAAVIRELLARFLMYFSTLYGKELYVMLTQHMSDIIH